MSKLASLQQQRAAKSREQMQMIEARNAAEGSDFTEDQTIQFRALDADIKELDIKIADEESVVAAQKRAAELDGVYLTSSGNGEQKEKEAIAKRFDMKRALSFSVDSRSLDGVEKEVNEMALEELRNQGLEVPQRGFSIPSEMMFRADSHTVTQDDGGFGGELVQETGGLVLPRFVDRLSIQDLGVDVKSGLVGNYPLFTGAEFTFQNVAETEKVNAQKSGYTKRVLTPKRTAMKTAISQQLLAQSSINVESDVRGSISRALNKRLILDLINGDGNAPNTLGILNDDLAFEYNGDEGPLTLAKILQLEGEVDEENVVGNDFKFLIHKKLASLAKGIPLDKGSGRFLMDVANKLYGTDTVKTSLLPTLTGVIDNYPLIYGDFSSVIAGFWGGMNIVVDPYTSIDSNEINLVVNVHRDIMASNPKAFAVNKKITLS